MRSYNIASNKSRGFEKLKGERESITCRKHYLQNIRETTWPLLNNPLLRPKSYDRQPAP